jgi:predicted ATPase/class 3 adenylate cyclase
MTDLPSGTVTFLFTDIEGSTKLAQQHPDSWEAARQRHDAILRQAIEKHHGYVFQIIGDAFCAAFHTAPDALAAALTAQRALQPTLNNQESTMIRVRMGLHTGAAEARDGDYQGYVTLVRVQRVMSVAYGGQIVLSITSAELVRGNVPAGLSLRDLGEHRLKGLLNPEHLWQVVVPELPQDFPPLQSLNAIPNNLPVQLTSFIGREKELAELKRLLPTTRLLTLTGSGGVGKTRLSLELAAEVLDTFKDGVWFIELAPLADPALIPGLIASTIGLKEQPGQALRALLSDYFHTRTALLMLDNCEHLIAECATLGDTLLRTAPGLAILASSREALGIAGELAWRVASLQIPNPAQASQMPLAELTQYEAVRLFSERAKFAQPAFAVSDANAPAVAQICYRLDGIPLAIELAAARIKLFPAEQIATRLDDRFRLLTGGSRTALPRQQTLRALIDWSYSLLSEPERVLLRRLAVFAGGWTLEAAEAVCADVVGAGLGPYALGWSSPRVGSGDSPASPAGPKDAPVTGQPPGGQPRGLPLQQTDVLDLLSHLVDKSLVVAEERTGSARYRMLETIRQYAREKLLESDEGRGLHDQHLDYFARLGAEAEPKLRGRELGAWLDRLEAEMDNIRTALSWSRETGRTEAGLSLAASLFWFWNLRGYQTEGLEWLQSLLALPAPVKNTLMRGRALNALALTNSRRGNYGTARPLAGEALEIGQELHDQQLVASAYLGLAAIAFYEGNLALAQSMREQSLTIWQALGDRHQIGFTISNMGMLAAVQGDYVRAEQSLAEGVRLMQEFGDKNSLSAAARFWGYALLYQDNDKAAATKFRESLTLNWELGDRQAVGACFAAYASLAVVREDFRRAVLLLGATDRVCESLDMRLLPHDQPFFDRCTSAARAKLDAAAFNAAWEAGRAMTIEQAIDLALKEANG